MAASRKSGKDSGGKYIYKSDEAGNLVDEEGLPLTVGNGPPAIDHDLDEIAQAFVNWGKSEGLSFLGDD